MKTGYIYIFKNQSFRENLIKIGRTKNSPSDRAKQLSYATGVPEEFDVAFDYEVYDSAMAEQKIHKLLKLYRQKNNREFFFMPVEVARKQIISVCKEINYQNGYSIQNRIVTGIYPIDTLDSYLKDDGAYSSEFISLCLEKTFLSQPGRSLLTKEQKQRVEIISDIFMNVAPLDLDKWCLDFSRDRNPEREITIWENIAKAFLKVDGVKYLSEQHKKEAYKLLLLKSQMSVDMVLQNFQPQMFSKIDAKEILRGYEGKSMPLALRLNTT